MMCERDILIDFPFFESLDIHSFVDDAGVRWYRIQDLLVATNLSRTNSSKFLKAFVPIEYRMLTTGSKGRKGRPAWYVTQEGIFKILLNFNTELSHQFRDWLVFDVLPKLQLPLFID